MAKDFYPKAKQAFGAGDLDWDANTIKVLLTEGYTYSSAHDNLDDVTAGFRVATSPALASKTNVNGKLSAADVTLPSVASGSTIDGYIVFKDTGTESTSTLICHVTEDPSAVALSLPTNGSDVVVEFDATNGILTL